jgi:hypothetical protein
MFAAPLLVLLVPLAAVLWPIVLLVLGVDYALLWPFAMISSLLGGRWLPAAVALLRPLAQSCAQWDDGVTSATASAALRSR